ncbi:glyoxylate reductase [Lipomyces tetrasporus]|uniref:Glyoxylate reductase n=1 Tax=Lipomyces tetrasporus TaxID=54092 RepID=A0AAD7QRK6_9ASCO|nr:glyoxylate reductase [Lipomyces tetrasporus]KAJ8100257.1 glyoxylate reductase [Lipomyces tetrasporus]
MTRINNHPRKRILAIGRPKFALAELAELEALYDVDFVMPTNRSETKSAIAEICAKTPAPYDACFWLFGWTHYKPFDKDLLEPVLPCGMFAGGGAGYDNVDVEWMSHNGAWYSNTPGTPTTGTADMHIFLMLAALRGTTLAERTCREGRWREGLPLFDDPDGKVLGIVGMGDIGREVAKKARIFNMDIIYYNRRRLPDEIEKELGAEYVSFEDLIKQCDVLSINCPLSKDTYHLISHKEFTKMKDGVYVVNTARGAIIDETALKEALISGKVCRAGLDVFESEPHIDPFFLNSDSVTIQPHYGGFSVGTIRKGEKLILENIKCYLETGKPVTPVNESELRLVN